MNKNLLTIIEERTPDFSKGQKRIAKFIIEKFDTAAYMTASKLGTEAGVSESTVVRFANELGFEGYPEMQKELREIIRTRLTSVQRVDVTNTLIGNDSILDRVLTSDAERIRVTLDEIDKEAFELAVDKILAAEHIYILGVRSSSTLAGFLNYNLSMIFDNIKFVTTASSSEMFEQIINMNERDVFIAISFPRYSTRVIKAVEFAHNQGADVISVTDGPHSPIAQNADQLLSARSDMLSYVDSLVAPFSIVNALVVALSRKCPDKVRERLEKLERIWDEYEVYDKSSRT